MRNPISALPNPNLSIEDQDEFTLFCMCIWAESRGVPMAAQFAVGLVILNRVEIGGYGVGLKGVILKPYQFSSFNENDPNRAKMLEPLKHDSNKIWQQVFFVADLLYERLMQGKNSIFDYTQGALFYFSAPLTSPPAAWGKVMKTFQYDDMQFFKPLGG